MNSSIILHGESDLGLTSPNTHPGGVPLQCCFVALPMYFQGYASDTVTHSKVGLNECVTHVVLSCSFPLPHPFLSVGVRQTCNLSPISLLRLAPPPLSPSIFLPLLPFCFQFPEACAVQMLLPVGESDGFYISKVLRRKKAPHYFNCRHHLCTNCTFLNDKGWDAVGGLVESTQ